MRPQSSQQCLCHWIEMQSKCLKAASQGRPDTAPVWHHSLWPLHPWQYSGRLAPRHGFWSKQHWHGVLIPLDINTLRVKCNHLAADVCLKRSQELLMTRIPSYRKTPRCQNYIQWSVPGDTSLAAHHSNCVTDKCGFEMTLEVCSISLSPLWQNTHHRSIFHWCVCTFTENCIPS